MSVDSRTRLFRKRDADDADRVTNIELFFDLVFVFAVTQLSHNLAVNLSLLEAVETAVLFLAIWWLWIYTSWATNWLDPEHGAVRSMLFTMMIGGLVLATAIPQAFGSWGMVFAATYITLQLARTLAIAGVSHGVEDRRVRNFLRIAFYFLVSLPFWMWGAIAHAAAWRLAAWAIALAIEYAGPFLFFRTPGLGASSDEDWDISGPHMAERCSLFIIIALGEAILVTGATFSAGARDALSQAAFLVSFLGSAAMWWVYFDTGAKRAGDAMESTDEVGRLARSAYTYFHMPIVAGIIVTAVADTLMLAHPDGATSLGYTLVACGGPFLFLVGNTAFKWVTAERPAPPLSHGVGALVLLATGLFAWLGRPTPLLVGALATVALIVTAAWEWFSLHGGWHRWTPWMGRRTAIAIEDSER